MDRIVLYHSISSYQLLEAIAHRQAFHRDDKAVIVLPDFITEKYPEYGKFAANGLFDEVYLFPYMNIPHSYRNVIPDTLRCYDRTIPYPIDRFSKIYIGGCHFFFSIVPTVRKVSFSVFEDSAGMVFDRMFLLKPLKKQFPVHAFYAKLFGLFSFRNRYISEVIVKESDPQLHKKQTEFRLNTELKKLSNEVVRSILDVFSCGQIEVGNNTAVLLTEQFSNLGMMSDEQQRRLYEYVCGTILYGMNIIIKPHPDDRTDYESFVSGCKVIRDVFPSELFPYMLTNAPMLMVTVSSTAIYAFSDYCDSKTLCEDKEFLKILKKMDIPTECLIRRKKL